MRGRDIFTILFVIGFVILFGMALLRVMVEFVEFIAGVFESYGR